MLAAATRALRAGVYHTQCPRRHISTHNMQYAAPRTYGAIRSFSSSDVKHFPRALETPGIDCVFDRVVS